MMAISLQIIILSGLMIGFSVPTKSPQETLHAKEAADRFVNRFRETLDFGLVFDEMSVSNSVRRMREARFFESMYLSAKLVDSVDDATLKRAYKAFMNAYYLKAAYDISIRPIRNEQKGDPPLPQEITSAMSSSRYLSLFLDEGTTDAPYATTRKELEQFVADFNRVAALYKKYLPPDFFNSETYKANVKVINKEGVRVHIRDGYESLGVGKETKVYEVDTDIFTFFFIEENGQIKVLTLGIGN